MQNAQTTRVNAILSIRILCSFFFFSFFFFIIFFIIFFF